MQILKYGICLESLTLSDLELVRNWRNSDHVRPYMQYQKIISPEMQVNWFDRLRPSNNLYFIISKDKIKAGLIHLKNIDWESGTAEAGIFIGDTGYFDTMVPVLATICMMELAFELMGLKTLRAKIENKNNKALRFNLNMGYRKMDGDLADDFSYHSTDPKQFQLATAKLRNTLDKLNREGYVINMNDFEKQTFLRAKENFVKHGLKLNFRD